MKVIITGSTGMVGKGVLLECLDDDKISQVLLINRSPIEIEHSKIKEVIHKDFEDYQSIILEFEEYDACFHCMGVSSAGMSEEQYFQVTFSFTEALVDATYVANRNMTFIYVSGEGTDSAEKSKTMWARVKGKTENLILQKGYRDAYAFRPGVILPERGVKSKTKLYNLLYSLTRPIFPIMKMFNSVTSTRNIGMAMIILIKDSHANKIFLGSDINNLVAK